MLGKGGRGGWDERKLGEGKGKGRFGGIEEGTGMERVLKKMKQTKRTELLVGGSP